MWGKCSSRQAAENSSGLMVGKCIVSPMKKSSAWWRTERG
nr:MAG TPA: hypothetical protein [Caudoviricetes sp.]